MQPKGVAIWKARNTILKQSHARKKALLGWHQIPEGPGKSHILLWGKGECFHNPIAPPDFSGTYLLYIKLAFGKFLGQTQCFLNK